MMAKMPKNQCKQVERYMRTLISDIDLLSNSPDDEYAYHVIHDILELSQAIKRAEMAGSDRTGNDEGDAYECVADAIRRSKER